MSGEGQFMPDDAILLIRAKEEIDRLRRANEILAAKVETMDLFKEALFARRPRGDKMEIVDVAHDLSRRIDALRVQEAMQPRTVGEHFEMAAAVDSAISGTYAPASQAAPFRHGHIGGPR